MNTKQSTLARNPTLKQTLWLKHYIETGNATEAARRAGYRCHNEGSLRVIGHENLTKLNASEIMEEMGLSKVNLLKVLATGLFKPVRHLVKRVITTNTPTGEIREVEYEEIPDYGIRFKYLQTALELHGLFVHKVTSDTGKMPAMSVKMVNYSDIGNPQ